MASVPALRLAGAVLVFAILLIADGNGRSGSKGPVMTAAQATAVASSPGSSLSAPGLLPDFKNAFVSSLPLAMLEADTGLDKASRSLLGRRRYGGRRFYRGRRGYRRRYYGRRGYYGRGYRYYRRGYGYGRRGYY